MRVSFILGIVIILDQLTKILIRKTMEIGDSIPILGQIFKITYVENPGIAFGIRVGSGSLFTVMSILASVGVCLYLVTHWKEGMLLKGSLSLIIGGAFGNLIDRILYNKVVDFIDIGIRDLRWPVFNVADSAVVIGMIILFYTIYISERKIKGQKEQPEQT